MSFSNTVRTVFFLGLLTGLFLLIGGLLGGKTGLTIALALAFVMNFFSYWFSDKIVLFMYRAKEADPSSRLVTIVREVAEKVRVPFPKVYVVPSANPNAFATGRSPKHAAVAATQGILDLLNENELRGVIAHELAHVKNRDILISSVAAMIAGAISYLATMAQWAAIFGGFGGRDNDNSNVFGLLALAILTPLLATLIHLAVSRSREYQADASGAHFIKDSYSLASALEKLHSVGEHKPMKLGNPSTAHLMIMNSFSGRAFMNLFSTHPPVEERVKRLRNMRV